MGLPRQQPVPFAPRSRAGEPMYRYQGSKHQLLTRLMLLHPGEPARYFEPFLGSGRLALELLACGLATEGSVLSDINGELLSLWRAVRDQVDDLVDVFAFHVDRHGRDHFRDQTFARPDDVVGRGARFLYLMSAGFNGLYRVNKRAGRFNVPQGDRFTPPTAELLRATSELLQGVQIVDGPYTSAILTAVAGDVVYFDPPYLGDWCGYDASGWTAWDTQLLAVTCSQLRERGVIVIVSCPDTPQIRAIFQGWHIQSVTVHRSGGGAGAFRGQVSELLITGAAHV